MAYNTVMARTDIPQSVKDEIRKNPDLLLDHDYMKSMLGDGPGTAESRTSVWDQITGAVGDAVDWLHGDSSSELGYVDDKGQFVYRTCFVAGTKVRTRDGFKNIEEIRAGDFVLSLNEKTGEQRYSRVTQTFIRQADRIYQLSFADGTLIETTWSHPFYIKGKGWIEAKDLRVGDVGVTAARTDLVITGIRVDARYETVYNFSVEDDHNYYVSEAQVLVHNSDYWNAMLGASVRSVGCALTMFTACGSLQALGTDLVLQRLGVTTADEAMQKLEGDLANYENLDERDQARLHFLLAEIGVSIVGTSGAGLVARVRAAGGLRAAVGGAGARTLQVSPRNLIGRQAPSEMTRARITRMANSMQKNEFDWIAAGPIRVAERNGVRIIIDGHHRAAAATQAGLREVPIVIEQVSDDMWRVLLQQASEATGR